MTTCSLCRGTGQLDIDDDPIIARLSCMACLGTGISTIEDATRGAYVPVYATQPADRYGNHPDSAERNTDTGDETT